MTERLCRVCEKPLPKGAAHMNKKIGNKVPYYGMVDFAAKQMLWGLKSEEEIVEALLLPDMDSIILVNPERAAALLATPKGAAALDRKIREAIAECVPSDADCGGVTYFGELADDALKGEEDYYLEEYYGKDDEDGEEPEEDEEEN